MMKKIKLCLIAFGLMQTAFAAQETDVQKIGNLSVSQIKELDARHGSGFEWKLCDIVKSSNSPKQFHVKAVESISIGQIDEIINILQADPQITSIAFWEFKPESRKVLAHFIDRLSSTNIDRLHILNMNDIAIDSMEDGDNSLDKLVSTKVRGLIMPYSRELIKQLKNNPNLTSVVCSIGSKLKSNDVINIFEILETNRSVKEINIACFDGILDFKKLGLTPYLVRLLESNKVLETIYFGRDAVVSTAARNSMSDFGFIERRLEGCFTLRCTPKTGQLNKRVFFPGL